MSNQYYFYSEFIYNTLSLIGFKDLLTAYKTILPIYVVTSKIIRERMTVISTTTIKYAAG